MPHSLLPKLFLETDAVETTVMCDRDLSHDPVEGTRKLTVVSKVGLLKRSYKHRRAIIPFLLRVLIDPPSICSELIVNFTRN